MLAYLAQLSSKWIIACLPGLTAPPSITDSTRSCHWSPPPQQQQQAGRCSLLIAAAVARVHVRPACPASFGTECIRPRHVRRQLVGELQARRCCGMIYGRLSASGWRVSQVVHGYAPSHRVFRRQQDSGVGFL